jgi:integrase
MSKLPSCMYQKHGAYYLVKRGKWTRLGKDRRAADAAYQRLTRPTVGAMPRLIDDAMVEIVEKVRPSTRKQYRTVAEQMKEMLVEFEPQQVTMADVAGIKRAYRSRPNMGNRALTVLRQVFLYAVENGICQSSPCTGLPRFGERKRDRLIQWAEYHAIRAQASKRLQVFMDLLVTTGQRPSDVLKIRRSDIDTDGIYFRQGKTGAKLKVKGNPGMWDAVERAKALHGSTGCLTLFRTRYGSVPAYRTVYDEWCRACVKAGVEDADLRDLRALAGTEAKRQGLNPQALLGHTTARMTERYLRDRDVPIVDGPIIRRLLDSSAK